jgi:hypothetical protein
MIRACTDAPRVPIKDSDIVPAVPPRQEDIPDMRIAVNDRAISMRVMALVEVRPRVDQLFTDYDGRAVADHPLDRRSARSAGQTSGVTGRRPSADPNAKAWVVPPQRRKLRSRSYDTLGLRHRRRQRPTCGDKMRVREVFEQKMPRVCAYVPEGFKAAREETRRRCDGNLRVERDFLATLVPLGAGAVGRPVLRIIGPGASAAPS